MEFNEYFFALDGFARFVNTAYTVSLIFG